MFWSVGWPLLRAEGFFYNLDILYGGLGTGKLQFWSKTKIKKIFGCNFFQFNTLCPTVNFITVCWERSQIIQKRESLVLYKSFNTLCPIVNSIMCVGRWAISLQKRESLVLYKSFNTLCPTASHLVILLPGGNAELQVHGVGGGGAPVPPTRLLVLHIPQRAHPVHLPVQPTQMSQHWNLRRIICYSQRGNFGIVSAEMCTSSTLNKFGPRWHIETSVF